jgi:putative phage-type endonuclease
MSANLAVKLTKDQDPEAWQIARRQGLGGSDMAAVLGVHPYKTAEEVYLDKLGLLPEQPPSPAMRRGEVLEPIAADEYQARTGRKLQRGHAGLPTGILAHPEYTWLRANIDRVVMPAEAKTIAEIKVPGLSVFARIKHQGVPPYIQIQGQHYLAVTGYERVLFIIFNAERWEVLDAEVERDEEIIGHIIEAGARFWKDHVLAQTPPPPAEEPQVKLPDVSTSEVVTMDSPQWAEAVALLRDARELKAGAEELEAQAKATLQRLMDEAKAQVAEGEGLRVYWRPQRGGRYLDTKALQAAHPELDLGPFYKTRKASRPFRTYFIANKEATE